MRFLRVLIYLRALPLVENNFLKVMFFPLAHLISKLTARKYNGLQGKNVLFIVIHKNNFKKLSLHFALYYWS